MTPAVNAVNPIEGLKKDITTDHTLNAAVHLFALRQRARSTITVQSLTKRLRREKFSVTAAQVQAVLKRLSAYGYGKLDTDYKGKIRSLKDINVNLQSLGEAVVGKADKVASFKPKRRFRKVAMATVTPAPAPKPSEPEQNFVTGLRVTIKGHTVELKLPETCSTGEIIELVSRLNVRTA